MSVLAVVTELSQISAVISWANVVAQARDHPLSVLCWASTTEAEFPLLAEPSELEINDALIDGARDYLTKTGNKQVTVSRSVHPDATSAVIAEIRSHGHAIVVAAESEFFGKVDGTNEDSPLFRRSPCETIILYRAQEAPKEEKRVLIAASDSPHDHTALDIFGNASSETGLKVTLTQLEDEGSAEGLELGRRELKRIMRDAGIKQSRDLQLKVYSRDDQQALRRDADKSDLLVIGANQVDLARSIKNYTHNPTIAAIKRAPPLTRLGRLRRSRWRTKISPADYADMMQGLRRGADLNVDFIVMLGLAAAIASLGLLQDSAAVVIGSMLLAPLMTPMIACGLAIAQANMKLGRRSTASIFVGFLLTLAISFVLGIVTPGNEITAQISARGNPSILDLLVALFSAAAAAYALARPSIIGAVAGVAIATALVPPLCSTGISLAYGEFNNAHGAAQLFATNLVAIVLGAAVTFRILGVTSEKAGRIQRQWVQRIVTATCLGLVVLTFPLQRGLDRMLQQGTSEAATYPLTKKVEASLLHVIANTPNVELVAAGRPSARYDRADVVIFLSSSEPLPRSYAKKLRDECRRVMDDPELVVEVHCFMDAWDEEE